MFPSISQDRSAAVFPYAAADPRAAGPQLPSSVRAPAMTPDESGTVLDDLPEEILVGNILVLLPPRDVGRRRAVRRSWRAATSTPEFTLDHHRHQPSLPIVELENHLGVFRDSADAKACWQRLWPFLPFVRIHAAGDGFLVISQLGSSQFFVCNPAIRQTARLLLPEFRPSNSVLALYRHDPTGEYRVLWSSMVEVNRGRYETTLHVLTVGARQSRNIGVGGPSASPSSLLQQKLIEALPRDPHSANYLRGNLHCMRMFHSEIIVFDTVAESFRLMPSATTDSHNCLEKLFHVEGKLAVCRPDSRFTYMGVWMMDDYEAEIWELKFRIDMSSLEASRALNLASPNKRKKRKMETRLDPMAGFPSDMTALNERELLIGFNDRHVLRCNIDGKLLGLANIQNGYYNMELTPHRLKESILPIPSSEI